MKLAEKVKEFFHNEGIHSTTIQPEFLEIDEVGTYIFLKFKASRHFYIIFLLLTLFFINFKLEVKKQALCS